VTFALRQLKRNLSRSKRLEKFATKSKRAISLIAKTLAADEKKQKLSVAQVAGLQKAANAAKAQLEALHTETAALAKASQSHKTVISTIAKELVKTQNTQNHIIDNVTALRTAAKAAEKGIKNLDMRNKASTVMIAEHAKKIVKTEKDVHHTTKTMAATAHNVKALHKAAVNAQKAILNLDARQVKTSRSRKNEKKALKLAFGAIKKLAVKANAHAQKLAKLKAKVAKKGAKGAKGTKRSKKASAK